MRRALITALLLAGCTAQPGAPAFKAATNKAAEDIVKTFLDAAQAGDASKVAGLVCDTSSGAREKAEAAVRTGPLAIQAYEITLIEPAWVGAEPYFRVDVELKKAAGKDARSLSVRAREACVDRLLGEPIEPARLPSGEISL